MTTEINFKRIMAFLMVIMLFIGSVTFLSTSTYAAQTKTVKVGNVTFTQNVKDSSEKTYDLYKFKAPQTGLLTITYKSGDSGYVQLTNNKKKIISKGVSYDKGDALNKYSSKVYYAVQKGKTYYIRYSGYIVKAKLSIKKIKDISGSSKKKSKSMKLNKQYKGLILAGQKTSKKDWFKIKLNKGRYYLNGYSYSASNAGFNIKAYDTSGKTISIDSGFGFYQPKDSTAMKDNQIASLYVPKNGTYYFSVQVATRFDSSKKASGSYVIGVIPN